MGAGIALEFRLRYPEMYAHYVEICQQNSFKIGNLSLYKSSQHWVINFPTKQHWKEPSKLEFLELGLQKFINTYREKEITSIAFPLLGAQNGGIPAEKSLEIMNKYLSQCELNVEVYIYDPNVSDDIFSDLKTAFFSLSEKEILEITGLGRAYFNRVKQTMQDDSICNISKFLSTQGIGTNTVQKTLRILQSSRLSSSLINSSAKVIWDLPEKVFSRETLN
jgi:hypothetical protein